MQQLCKIKAKLAKSQFHQQCNEKINRGVQTAAKHLVAKQSKCDLNKKSQEVNKQLLQYGGPSLRKQKLKTKQSNKKQWKDLLSRDISKSAARQE